MCLIPRVTVELLRLLCERLRADDILNLLRRVLILLLQRLA